jgi:hypothetical protein
LQQLVFDVLGCGQTAPKYGRGYQDMLTPLRG